MGIYKIQLTDKEVQEQSFSLFDMNLRLTLRFNSISNSFMVDLFDITNSKQIAMSKGLSCYSPALFEYDLPFIIVLNDTQNLGINPISKEDLYNRFEVLMINKEAYREAIRESSTA